MKTYFGLIILMMASFFITSECFSDSPKEMTERRLRRERRFAKQIAHKAVGDAFFRATKDLSYQWMLPAQKQDVQKLYEEVDVQLRELRSNIDSSQLELQKSNSVDELISRITILSESYQQAWEAKARSTEQLNPILQGPAMIRSLIQKLVAEMTQICEEGVAYDMPKAGEIPYVVAALKRSRQPRQNSSSSRADRAEEPYGAEPREPFVNQVFGSNQDMAASLIGDLGALVLFYEIGNRPAINLFNDQVEAEIYYYDHAISSKDLKQYFKEGCTEPLRTLRSLPPLVDALVAADPKAADWSKAKQTLADYVKSGVESKMMQIRSLLEKADQARKNSEMQIQAQMGQPKTQEEWQNQQAKLNEIIVNSPEMKEYQKYFDERVAAMDIDELFAYNILRLAEASEILISSGRELEQKDTLLRQRLIKLGAQLRKLRLLHNQLTLDPEFNEELQRQIQNNKDVQILFRDWTLLMARVISEIFENSQDSTIRPDFEVWRAAIKAKLSANPTDAAFYELFQRGHAIAQYLTARNK